MYRFCLFLLVLILQLAALDLAALGDQDSDYQWDKENQVVDSLHKAIFKNPVETRAHIFAKIEREQGTLPDFMLAKFYNLLGVSYAVVSNADSALYAFNMAIKISPLTSSFNASVKKNMGNVHRNVGAFDKAFDYYFGALSDAYVLQDESLTSVLYGEISSTYSLINKPELAIEYLQMAIKQNEDTNLLDSLSLAILYQKLANIYSRQKNYKLSQHYYEFILPLLINSTRKDVYYLSLINLSTVYLCQDNTERSLALLDSALIGVEELHLQQLLPLIYAKYINAYFYLKDEAAIAVNFSKMISGVNFNNANHLAVLLEYADLLLNKGDFDDLEHVLAILDEHQAEKVLLVSDLILYQKMKAQLFAEQRRYKEAYNELVLSASISDSLRLSDASAALHGLAKKAELEKQIQQTIIFNQKVKLSNRRSIIVLILLIFMFLAGLYVLRVKNYRQRILLLENQKLETLNKLGTERINQQKQAFISASNENIILLERLQKLIKKHGDEMELNLTGWSADSQLLQAIINRSELLDSHWLDKLKRSVPSLSRSELEFCLLLHLGLPNKDIAQLLNISHASVHTKKYRLIKKIDLPGDMDLLTWLSRVANSVES